MFASRHPEQRQADAGHSSFGLCPFLCFHGQGRGLIFSTHDYYMIPFVPVMALFAAYGLLQICGGWISYAVLAVIMFEGVFNQQHDLFLKESEKIKLEYEVIADQFCDKDELVIINGGIGPQSMYFLHRKGWSVNDEDLSDLNYLDELHKKGRSTFLLKQNTCAPYCLMRWFFRMIS